MIAGCKTEDGKRSSDVAASPQDSQTCPDLSSVEYIHDTVQHYHGRCNAVELHEHTLVRYASLLTAHAVPCRTYCVGYASEAAATRQLGTRETRCAVTTTAFCDSFLPEQFPAHGRPRDPPTGSSDVATLDSRSVSTSTTRDGVCRSTRPAV
jgi:hypothetical protein